MRVYGPITLVASVLLMAGLGHIIITLFGKSIPDVMMSFFKGVEEFVVLGLLLVFVLAWMRRARPRRHAGQYEVVAFDVFGNVTRIDGIRTAFATNDVATSFAKQYKESHPLHNFAVLTDIKEARRTIVRYV